jgi:hypothetical protein
LVAGIDFDAGGFEGSHAEDRFNVVAAEGDILPQ